MVAEMDVVALPSQSWRSTSRCVTIMSSYYNTWVEGVLGKTIEVVAIVQVHHRSSRSHGTESPCHVCALSDFFEEVKESTNTTGHGGVQASNA